MNGLNGSTLRAATALVIGLILVLFPEQASEYLVIAMGVIFLVPSLIGIVGYFTHDHDEYSRFPIEAIGSLLFGLWLMIMPGFFADLLTIVFGFILLMGGIYQLTSLCLSRRVMPVPGIFFVTPVLILLAGVMALFNPTGARSTALIILGIGSLIYALTELVNFFRFVRRRPKPERPAVHKVSSDVEDAEVIENED